MKTQTEHRWIVVVDDERKSFGTRKQARAEAAWLARHPANMDARRFGPYANVDGQPRIIDSWATP